MNWRLVFPCIDLYPPVPEEDIAAFRTRNWMVLPGDSPVGDGAEMTCFVDGPVYVFSYADPAAAKLVYVSVSLPDDSEREHGLAPR